MPPTPPPTHLYKILPTAPPSPLPPTLPLSDLDKSDGFIHLSTASQVPGTAARFFADSAELWLLKIRLDAVHGGVDGGEVKWEAVEIEGEVVEFPHLFGGEGLGVGNVEEVVRVERGMGWGGLRVE
ncbi:hypothetical protein DM02DRAFT_627575 [Periconia macrospinosa]|uniref:DUF952-domain-containing protein n=1 Tax=Periconia macrospinosa TaxID=97972 RepID=A0A2V1DU18_9PLEO|nr:hypothetical protein DM02DRAFT_627575 [Periconia macrospinosa]